MIYLIGMESDDWFDDEPQPLLEYGYYWSEDAALEKIQTFSAKQDAEYADYKVGLTEKYKARKADYDRLRAACDAAGVPVPEEVSEPLPPYIMSLRQWSRSSPTYIPIAIEPGE